MEHILLCTDLDRTLLPNGLQPESSGARPLFRALCRRPEVTLAYVSGRDQTLLRDAIDEYELPLPDYAIGDVGTTLYAVEGEEWNAQSAWSREIGADWADYSRDDLEELLSDVSRAFELCPQEPEKQNTHKLSYYAPPRLDRRDLFESIRSRLSRAGVRAGLIWSVDETRAEGLLDVLPESANKLHAIRFLMNSLDITQGHTLFAGDSGNDLPVLTSGIPSVLVANATADVQNEARAMLAGAPQARLYFARGGFEAMNGNYAAGILEGVNHFFPWLANRAREFAGKVIPQS